MSRDGRTSKRDPFNHQAERSVLGALLLFPERADEVKAALTTDDFHLPVHREVFDVIGAQLSSGGGLDIVTVGDRLDKRGHHGLDEGIQQFLVNLARDCEPVSLSQHIAIVLEEAALRRIINAASEIQDRAHSGTIDDVAAFTASAEQLMADAAKDVGGRRDPAPRIGSFADAALELMERRLKKEERPIETPWPQLNKLLGSDAEGKNGGLWPGLHVLTAGTGKGKTQWALQLALKAAQGGSPVLYIGLELGPSELVGRLLGLMDKNLRWSDAFYGRSPGAYKSAYDMGCKLDKLPLRLEVPPPFGWSPDVVSSRVKTLRKEAPSPTTPVLVVLDYLQLVSPPQSAGRRMDLREVIGKAAYSLRSVARDQNATVIALSSVSRESAKFLADDKEKGSGDPTRWEGMGKEAGEIETAADTVMTMAAGAWNGSRTEMHLAVAKFRAGRPGWAKLEFNGSRFEDEEAIKPQASGPIPGVGRSSR